MTNLFQERALEEYAKYHAVELKEQQDKNKADVDYIAMMCDIDLDDDDEEEGGE